MRRAFILVLLLTAATLHAQQFIGFRTKSGWSETPMLRKTFKLAADDFKHYDFQTVTFTVDVASLGYHEVYVNDRKVGNTVLQPAVSQLDKHALKVRYDISNLVHEGDNEIMLWPGQGWGRIYGTPAAVMAEVTRTVSDRECGLEYTLAVTDTTWMAQPSPYSYTGSWQPMQFGGERYDARVSDRYVTRAKIYDAKNITLSRQEFAGNRITDTIKPQSTEQLADGSTLLDFGRVVTGWLDAVF